MKIKKSLLSVCLSISLMFGCFVPSINVYASSGEGSSSNFLKDNWNKAVSFTAGVMTDAVDYTADFLQWLTSHKSNYGISNSEDPDDWVQRNVDVDQSGNVTISDNVINSMRDCVSNYITTDTDFVYGYAYSASDWQSRFESSSTFQSFVNVLADNEDNFCIAYTNQYNWPSSIYVYDLSHLEFVHTYTSSSYFGASLYYDGSLLSLSSQVYKFYTLSNGSYIEQTPSDYINYGYFKFKPSDSIVTLSEGKRVTSLNGGQYLLYNSGSSVGGSSAVQDYYVSDSYNTEHITGSYNTTVTDITNAPTYTDVNSYINEYYLENNNYPTTTQIYNYINNYDPSSGDDPSDPNDPSDPEDPDDPDGIWALIKKVLQFFSKLIDTIAGFLADLVDSLGDVVTAVIDNILNIFTSLKDGIPNVIAEFLEWFFPFLPDEIIALINLSIVCAVIVGLIRLIRGH